MPDRKEESRLRAVVNTAVDGVILIDADGVILMFNPACEKMFGYSAEEVIGQNVKILMPPPYRDEHDDYIANYRRTGEAKIIGIGREVVGQHKDGTVFPIDLSVSEARQNGETIFVGIIRDLTERRKQDRAVREVAARLRAVVDTAMDGVILIDASGTILMFNPACERLFGYAADEVVGRNVKMLMAAPYRDDYERFVRTVGVDREGMGERKDGTTFPMTLSVGEAKQDGESIYVGIIHDLTERKRTEEQLVQAQKMEGVGQLSGGIAHDFNNLLTVIIGNASTLSETLKARPDLQRMADAIVTAGERGAELTRRLLAFSRRQTLMPVEVDCNRLIGSMEQLLRRTLRDDIEINAVFDPALWPAFADPVQLESAILNLAINARDAMPDGGTLSITTGNLPLDEHYRELHPEVPAGQYVVISVTDDGAGMPPEVLERVFEPFFTTKDVGKGSGLGLSMVYGFVKQSNGHITIYSELGLGTTVRIYLPASRNAQAALLKEALPDDEPLPHGGATVLVVEDDPFVRGYAASTLESLGYAVVTAVDGRDALSQLAKLPDVDLLFTDIVMPGGINGWELVERALRLKPGLRVLLTSGYALETLASRGRLPTGAVVLNKPYRKAELARRLHEALQTIH
ncbi:MAG TPA: PAS domain S-box protein [Alphaproteobacteria bacterium]